MSYVTVCRSHVIHGCLQMGSDQLSRLAHCQLCMSFSWAFCA